MTQPTTFATADYNNQRVILLLDLDCFYAQCECVRLGLDARTTPLALLQWNSVLAVTYPARRQFDIQRGDSWDAVRNKSKSSLSGSSKSSSNGEIVDNSKTKRSGDNETTNHATAGNESSPVNDAYPEACYTVHVPILTTDPETTTSTLEDSTQTDDPSTSTGTAKSMLHDDYEAIYRLSPDQQLQARRSDLGVRKFSAQGKACIERYRVASARIFATVLEWIQESGFSNDVILERASIDEFFLDVTAACRQRKSDDDIGSGISLSSDALQETVVIGEQAEQQQEEESDAQDGDLALSAQLERGCWIARSIRQAIWDKLGFTLSSGISINKTLAKLSASYGKPDGQAVTFPHAMEYLLQDTPIRKCRNLGGKLGARVQALLPPNVPPNVGSIAKYVSLPTLRQGLGSEETARWVFDMARGIDRESVVAKNESALTKSITAFKSLPFQTGGHSFEEASTWIRLLAREVVTRVEKDATRNRRYPRSCTIQYAYKGQQNKSVRTNFPSERCSTEERIDELAVKVPKMIRAKEGKTFRFNRIGLCATEFVPKEASRQSIDRFFVAAATKVESTAADVSSNVPPLQPQQLQQQVPSLACTRSTQDIEQVQKKSEDIDLELAQKLQAGFDRENRLFQALDKRNTSFARPIKTRKIDSFFTKSKR